MAETVKMKAYADLVDPVAGFVSPNDKNKGEFETTPEAAEQYRKAQWAGPPGTDPRDIQLEVARKSIEKRTEARKFALSSRQALRSLAGYDHATDVQPQVYGTVASEAERRTNQQVVEQEDEGKKQSKSNSKTGNKTEAKK